ncbi:unnamed protein product [Spirodela intermedia]|uniref:HVA22-like protein n=1 Tax=Spirodela intermedia TaxID=51605 RepID=A0A7I8KRU4_SPIIN|nr:unnamed protein product [Spirodela intermedia]
MDQLWIVLNHLQSLVGYASVRAIESPSSVDDEQWLAYWILYSFLTLTEMVAEPVLNWFPMWYHVKVAFMAWLVLPQFRGAAFVYERFVRQQIRKYSSGAAAGAGGRRKKSHPHAGDPRAY